MKNYYFLIFLIFIIISLNYHKIFKKYFGGIKEIETNKIKLEKSKNNYRIILHNIIRMENILNYNNNFNNNHNFSVKLNYLKLLKNTEYNNLSNILNSTKKTKIITKKIIKEETPSANKYARLFTAELILKNKYLINNSKIIDEEINNIELLGEQNNLKISKKYKSFENIINQYKSEKDLVESNDLNYYKKKYLECKKKNDNLEQNLKNLINLF